MLFSIIVLVLVAAIVYFHWVQGLLSGIVSMVLAVLAGSLAVGYGETLAAGMLGGKVPDMSTALCMGVVFVVVYGVGRIVFDSLIPGNVQLPLYFDRVGGAACGLVAGIFAVGTFAIAMQWLPVGPSVAYHSRYEIAEDKDITVPGSRRQEDATVTGALAEDLPDPAKEIGLMLGVDSMVADFAAFQSESGALAGAVPLRQVHPNLLRELFLQRVGIETGAKHTALNVGGKNEVEVTGVYAPATLPQIDGELNAIRSRKLPPLLRADPRKVLLVVRTTVKTTATDQDNKFRFSPGMIRLVVGGNAFHPIGTLHHPGNVLLANRIDDYLVAEADKTSGTITIDFVFEVDRADVLTSTDPKEEAKVKPGAFLEVKRFARVDLSEKTAGGAVPEGGAIGGMIRKKEVVESIGKRLAETVGQP